MRKRIAFLLAVLLLLSMVPAVVAAEDPVAFPDIPKGFWAEDSIDYMSASGYLQGKKNGTFGPTDPIMRKTVAILLYRIKGQPQVTGSTHFSDVKQDLYYDAILWAVKSGIVTGYPDGTFRPDATISRQHFAIMLYRYCYFKGYSLEKDSSKKLTEFSDYRTISDASRNACYWAYTRGIISGRSNGTFDPQGSTSRAQLAVIMTRFLKLIPESKGETKPSEKPEEVPAPSQKPEEDSKPTGKPEETEPAWRPGETTPPTQLEPKPNPEEETKPQPEPQPTEPVDYVWEEAEQVAQALDALRGKNGLTFLVGSDMHNMAAGEYDNTQIEEQIRTSNKNGGRAMSLIAENTEVDFIANLGDFAWGDNSTTMDQANRSILEAVSFLPESTVMIPGNHDPNLHSFGQNGEFLDDQYLESTLGSYHYTDYEKQKIRVIFLNTAETSGVDPSKVSTAEHMSAEQMQWFAQSLDLSGKENAEKWGILIFSHHPLDWGGIAPAANLLQAYLTGRYYSAVCDGTAISYDFSGRNHATVIAQFHGHVHCLKTDYIHYVENNVGYPTSVKRIAVPNMCFYRNNEYGKNGKSEYYGIEFGEPGATYYKKADTASETAFCAVTVDRDAGLIYVLCYGAGYDRVISIE